MLSLYIHNMPWWSVRPREMAFPRARVPRIILSTLRHCCFSRWLCSWSCGRTLPRECIFPVFLHTVRIEVVVIVSFSVFGRALIFLKFKFKKKCLLCWIKYTHWNWVWQSGSNWIMIVRLVLIAHFSTILFALRDKPKKKNYTIKKTHNTNQLSPRENPSLCIRSTHPTKSLSLLL